MRKIKFKSREVVSRAPESENKPEIKKDDVKLSYKVYGQDFSLNDIDYIDYYRTRMKMMAMRFMLVGRIDDKGVYRIKNEIKYDLINMLKEISDEGEDFIRGEAYFMKKYFYFHIDITRDGLKAKASLYLSEFVDDFLDDEYIVSHIADFEDVDDQHFVNKTKEAYNLQDVALKNDELKIPNLAVLMQDEYDIDKYIGGLYDIASQIYLMRMLKLLEESGDPVCLDIIRRYRELSVDIDENESDEYERRNINKNTRLKALLDRAIDEKGGLEKLPVNKEKLKNIVHEINKSVKAIDGLQMNPAAIEILRPDSPKGGGGGSSALPKKVAGKSQPKKSSGGQPKKNDKKPSATSAGKPKTDKPEKKEDKKTKPLYTGNPFAELEKKRKKEKEEEMRRRAAKRGKDKQEGDLDKGKKTPAADETKKTAEQHGETEGTKPAPSRVTGAVVLPEDKSNLGKAEGTATQTAEGNASLNAEGTAVQKTRNKIDAEGTATQGKEDNVSLDAEGVSEVGENKPPEGVESTELPVSPSNAAESAASNIEIEVNVTVQTQTLPERDFDEPEAY